MLTRTLFSIALLCPLLGFAQHFPTNPDSGQFVTEDIDRFWAAYDQFWEDTNENPFEEMYMELGTEGVAGFTPYRIESAKNLKKVVLQNKDRYDERRERTLLMKTKEKQCRAAFYALKYWYPEAQYPPVFFVIGVFNSGGTASDAGLMIGAEMQPSLENVPFIVAHELIHFQQRLDWEGPTLLEQSIKEGSADFIGELISGDHINGKAFAYGAAHEEGLCKEFVTQMDKKNFKGWLYGGSGKDDRPNDLGYWMGYQISKAYFDRAKDKKQAIRDILTIKDANTFLKESGYLNAYLNY